MKKKKATPITKLFLPPKAARPVLKPQPPVPTFSLLLPDTSTSQTGPGVGSTSISTGDVTPSPSPLDSIKPVHTLLSRLCALTANLPFSVPIGHQDEPLACFSTDPETLVQPGQDAWEDVIDLALNQVIGFGRTSIEIAGFIR